MEIVFVRHAEKKEGDEDLGLSEKGIQQSKNLAKRLRDEKFDEFYCSSLKRAIETAKIVSEELKVSFKIEEVLNEFDSKVLKLDKKEWDEKSKLQYDQLKSFLNNFTERAEDDKRILIIAHGTINRLILAILLELELKNIIRFRLLETGISEVYWMPKFKNWRLKYWNDISYQPKELVEEEDEYQ